ncbi:hypothetical protein [Aestuariimicrobium sp. T2.26MG-19.2B]|uniref:hypothetical protein n=1 Tax=Aestuariimicrobium sp. T2.26MG-19.2B TaxID=3040679 RepID=UPI002477B103|nr:hypothetical protein [Aestuariimicrobium sp. T2.26MG-19.2B]CAI9411751.1 hypothetical protein AESSP_02713 [Aestuariimicrobium sp. T2.26MG-19.2B]
MSEELTAEAERAIRATVAAVARVMEVAQRRRAEQERQGRDQAMSAGRADEAQFKEWVRGQQDVYRRVGWADWEDQATPAEWADAYATARGMRDVDPMAVHAANRIEQQYWERFGVNLREAHDLWRKRSSTLREEHVGREAEVLDVPKLVAEHRPHYRVVADDWWRENATQADWVDAYGHARVTLGLDPMAETVAQRIESETRQRFGLDVKAAFDDELARRTSGLVDEAGDLAAQSRENERASGEHHSEADGLDPDDPRVEQLREQARREQAMADTDLHGSEDAVHEQVVVATVTEADAEEADRVARKAAPAYTPADEAAAQSHRGRRNSQPTSARPTQQRKRGRSR